MNENTFKISQKLQLNKLNLNEIKVENQNNYSINFYFSQNLIVESYNRK